MPNFSIHAQIEPKNMSHELYSTSLNLEKFHKVEFNLEFDETIVVGFTTECIF